MDNLTISLQMTAIGMSLVFGAILVLWLVMDLLMRVTNLKIGLNGKRRQQEEEARQLEERRRKAAAAAVAMALAEKSLPTVHEFPLPPTAFVSAWQAVMRASNLKSRGPVR
jgi:Na+-transporting methylmalonyl-CoA/oxaloacetate decarboxylase gamma subunit